MDYDEFTDTQLYKSLDEFNTELTLDELRRKVYKACVDNPDPLYRGFDSERLNEAFSWAETPEGWGYWMRIWESKHRGIVIKNPVRIVAADVFQWPVIEVMA